MKYILFLFPLIAFSEEDLHFRGRLIYAANCISCHNSDPKKNGTIGPDVWGSSKELLKLKILEGKYPKDYKPKRDTKIMPEFPHLKMEIEALYRYLNGIKEKK